MGRREKWQRKIELETPEMKELLVKSGSNDFFEAMAYQRYLAKALELPLRKGLFRGDIVSDIYQPIKFDAGVAVEFPLDPISPGTEKYWQAYTFAHQGRIPERQFAGDYVMVKTYDTVASADWTLRMARNARWDVLGRAYEVIEASHIRKDNTDGWQTIIAAAVGRNVVVLDDAAPAGLFTKRLLTLADTSMRRNAGGNSTSLNRGKLTDVYMSPEGVGDMRSWDLTQIDDFTRREIFLAGEGDSSLTRIFGINIHDIDEFGVAQEYQNYFAGSLAQSMTSSKVEIVIGLDLSKDDCFVHPFRLDLQIFEDPMLHRQLKAGLYSMKEAGWAVLDSRRTLLLEY